MDQLETLPKWLIYCHTHSETQRRYIGQTSQSLERRWSQHCSQVPHLKSHFANAIRKYGKAAFEHTVIQVCFSKEQADAAEKFAIWFFCTRDLDFGFNIAVGGQGKPNPSPKNPWLVPGFREKVSVSTKLAAAKPESKKLRSHISKGLWSDPEFREKNLAATLATRKDPEVRVRMSAGMRKRYEDPLERAKSAARWNDPDFRARCSVGLTDGKNKNKNYCSRGHEYTPGNTKIDSQGYRRCQICLRGKRWRLIDSGNCECCGRPRDCNTQICIACKSRKETKRLSKLGRSIQS